jgi:hypothetical protein
LTHEERTEIYQKSKSYQAIYREVNKTRLAEQRAQSYRKNIALRLWQQARHRAARLGVSFSIVPEDVVVPARCPVFGIYLRPAEKGGSRDHSPSLDRIRPEKGYVPGNVIVISYKANTMKNNGDLVEMRALVSFYEWLLEGGNVAP